MNPWGYSQQHDTIAPRFHRDLFSTHPHPVAWPADPELAPDQSHLGANFGSRGPDIIDDWCPWITLIVPTAPGEEREEEADENGAYSVLHSSRMIGDSALRNDDGF